MPSERGRMVALLLAIFLGEFGIHRFYAGKVVTGVIWLCTVGLFGIGWIIDIFLVAFGAFTDSEGRRISRW